MKRQELADPVGMSQSGLFAHFDSHAMRAMSNRFFAMTGETGLLERGREGVRRVIEGARGVKK